MAADAIVTCVAAAVGQMGGYMAVRLGLKKRAITNVQACIEYQLNRI